jgi:hypothetical protein
MSIRLLMLLWLWSVGVSCARALEPPPPGRADLCPALAGETEPPRDFAREGCRRVGLHQIDPQGRHLWVRLRLAPQSGAREGFVGLLIAAKASSEVWLAGTMVGANGRPGADAAQERPGRMDAVIPLDPDALADADHVLVLRMSSHHGWLRLQAPLHALELVDHPNPQDLALRYYLPSLLPLGVFGLACFYFIALTWLSERRAVPALLAALATLAATQLLLEVSRGVFAYAYPLQDLRLIGILACSAGFGLCLVAVLARMYLPGRLPWLLGLVATAMAAAIALTSSMDSRTALMLLIAGLGALMVAAFGIACGQRSAWAHLLALSAFNLGIALDPSGFVDLGFYLWVALLMVALMVLQAAAYSRERSRQVEQRLRADRLQRALDQRQAERSPPTLSVPGTGRLRQIAVDRIVRIQGAGDYVELVLDDGSQLLHSANLGDLDAELPPGFLRVHRSHLVNMRFIDRLERSEGGTGTLHLLDGAAVPVSRRVMPGVRRALR